MKTKLVIRTVHGMNEDDFKKCRNLNLGNSGSMRGCLVNCREYPGKFEYAYAYMIKNAETDELLSWSLLYKRKNNRNSTAHYYTRSKARRHKYGTRIAAAQLRREKKPLVYDWDDRSFQFFKSTGLLK